MWAGIAMWWVLAVLAVLGWRLLARAGVAARWWLAVPLLTVVVTAVAFYGAHRIRAPAEPVIVVLAAVAVCAQLTRRGRPSGFASCNSGGSIASGTF